MNELKARGMPLGLMPGSKYEEKEVTIDHGEIVLFSSDGIAEAHNTDGEMFGCPRIIDIVANRKPDEDLRDLVLEALDRFTGPDHEQEDDITMVTLERTLHDASDFERGAPALGDVTNVNTLLEFDLPSNPGNEREAMARVADAIAGLGLDDTKLEKVKTAVAEATMNAIEHGNKNDPDLPVVISVTASDDELRIKITDHGGGEEIPEKTAPDLTPENYDFLPGAARPRFLDDVLRPRPEQVRFEAVLSEQGGRFFRGLNRYLIIETDADPVMEHPDFRWMTLHQLVDLLRHSHYLNVQARSLVCCLHSLSWGPPRASRG